MKLLLAAMALTQSLAKDFTAEQIQNNMIEYFTLFAGESEIKRESVT